MNSRVIDASSQNAALEVVRYRGLFGLWPDVLLLGGGSVIALLALELANLDSAGIAALAVIMLVLANFVNHPHFSYSYQIFYSSWQNVKDKKMPAHLRRKWWFAGVIAPLLLAFGLIVGAILWLHDKPFMLGLMLTSMGVLVGWHYVKQGFGMAMMDAALKKSYWSNAARKALLVNAYCCWIAAFTFGRAGNLFQEVWGLAGVHLVIPGFVTAFACTAAAISTAWCCIAVYRAIGEWKRKGLNWVQWPLAGLVGYVVTLYLWLGLIQTNAGFILVVPFFHSLQYLSVITRYKLNESKLTSQKKHGLALFFGAGLMLGALGFWVFPGLVEFLRTGSFPDYRGNAALAMGSVWVFINVHHYFIDNVLWRKENERVNQCLFAAH